MGGMLHTVKEDTGAAYLLATVSPMHRVGNFRQKKLFRGTKIEANAHNSVPNPSGKRKQLRFPIRATKNRNKLSECRSEPFRGRETNSEQNAAAEYFKNSVRKDDFDVQTNHFVK